MTVQVIKSTDAGAPAQTTVAGSMINLLDYCLVGIGGWEKTFTGTNKAVYRPPTGNRFYLRIDDSAANTSIVRAYTSMTSVDVGSNPFPTTVELSDSTSLWLKVNNNPWMVVVSERGAYVITGNGTDYTGSGPRVSPYYFGDFPAFSATDTLNTFVNAAAGYTSTFVNTQIHMVNSNMFTAGSYMSTLPASTKVAFTADVSATGFGQHFGAGGYPYPNPANGSMIMVPVLIHEPYIVRGRMPGLWQVSHSHTNFTNWQSFSGTGTLSGRNFILQRTEGGIFAIETSDTWWT